MQRAPWCAICPCLLHILACSSEPPHCDPQWRGTNVCVPPAVSHSGGGRMCECGGGWRQRAPAAAALSSLSPPTHSLWGRAALWALGAYIWAGENRVFAPALMPQGQTRHGSPIPNAYHGPEGSGCAVERDLGSHRSSSSLLYLSKSLTQCCVFPQYLWHHTMLGIRFTHPDCVGTDQGKQ